MATSIFDYQKKKFEPIIPDKFPKIITSVTKVQVEADGSSRVISHFSTIKGQQTRKRTIEKISIESEVGEELEL